MITDADVKKLSKVFATKNDLDKKLKPIHKKIDTLDTKVDRLDIRVGRLETKVDDVKSSIDTLVVATGNILEWTDDIHRAIVGTHKKSISDN